MICCKQWIGDKRKQRKIHCNKNTTNLEQDLIMNGQALKGVENCRYLGALKNSKN
jgi:hypothetical protein